LKKEIDLSNLPIRNLGSREVIDWKNIKNEKVKFEYLGISDYLTLNYSHTKKLPNYKTHYLTASYNGQSILIAESNLRKVKLGGLLSSIIQDSTKRKEHNYSSPKTLKPYKYKLGEQISKKETIFIVQNHFRNKRNNKAYKVKCKNCNNSFEHEEHMIENMKVCPYCTNSRIKQGYNDVATTHPEVIEYVVNKELLYKNSFGSANKVVTQCPYCLKTRNQKIVDLVRYGFNCSCQTSSKGEQIIEACLKSNNIPYKREFIIDYDNRRRYDFMFTYEGLDYIVEVMGEQHFRQVKGWGDLKETQENDKIKKEIAIQNNFNYISLDWSHGSSYELLEEFKRKIPTINSINISKHVAIIPKLNRFVELWEGFPYQFDRIEKELNIGSTTRKKLQREAIKLGLINYDEYKARTHSHIKHIVSLNERRVFYGVRDIINEYKVDKSSVYGNCRFNSGDINNRHKSAGKHPITKEPLQWMYLEDYLVKYGEEGLKYIE